MPPSVRVPIFDSIESAPLPLTRENLSHCLGVPYGGIVRGYAFVPQPKAKLRVEVATEEPTVLLAWT